MKYSVLQITLMIVIVFVLGYTLGKRKGVYENFTSGSDPICGGCQKSAPSCGCTQPRLTCPPCREPDLSKYVLKASIPPPPAQPDMSRYMLKSECPPVPDLTNYVLKSSIPRQAPVILDCSKCKKPKGECPPCPRARCPEVKCPDPVSCPPCAPCERSVCPQQVVKCKAQDAIPNPVRPYLAPLNMTTFGQ
jgi:hypothetical protein